MVSLFLSEEERECSNFERDRAHERFKFFKLILIFLPAREHRIGQHRQSIVPVASNRNCSIKLAWTKLGI